MGPSERWQVRSARTGDGAALALVAGATFLETYHDLLPAADMVEHTVNRCCAAVFDGWIADGGSAVFYGGAAGTDAPVGYAVLTAPDFPIELVPGDIELRRIYTLAAMHGSGLGAALIAAALNEARARDARRVLLGVHPDNHRARRFYENSGFAVIGERQFVVGTQRFTDPVYARAV